MAYRYGSVRSLFFFKKNRKLNAADAASDCTLTLINGCLYNFLPPSQFTPNWLNWVTWRHRWSLQLSSVACSSWRGDSWFGVLNLYLRLCSVFIQTFNIRVTVLNHDVHRSFTSCKNGGYRRRSHNSHFIEGKFRQLTLIKMSKDTPDIIFPLMTWALKSRGCHGRHSEISQCLTVIMLAVAVPKIWESHKWVIWKYIHWTAKRQQ